MNMFSNMKKGKKFILVLVLLLLFNFCFPKRAEAMIELEDFPAIPAQILYVLEKGVLKYLNNLFTNEDHHTTTTIENEKYSAESYEIYLTPENIIKGKFILFDANIFKNIQDSDKYYDDGAFGGAINSGKDSLRNVIAGWYYALRNFAIIALLSVLVYVGIRMIMSTIAQDKAKYKIMFKDWLVALCLVVVMHYMMIGILNISSMITDALGGGKNANTIGKLTERISGVLSESSSTNEDGGEDWFDRHYGYEDDEGTYDLGDAYAFILVLGGIIIYTFIFAVKYLKREFTIIFLILLGPVSCVTYPIDKISDGKAQAFNRWFSEFLYQVIIQPFHLLLYIVLVGSAVELANKNVIYALICFAVMIPAEKFIKEMFGFKDKLGSPLGAFAGGALASKAISALTSKGKGAGGSGGKDDGGDNNSTPNELPPRTVDKPGLVGGTDNGEENTEKRQVGQQENQALESGEEPGGSASAADAYQNSDDPVAAAERAALEEQIADGQLDEDDLTDQQRALLGMGQGTEVNQQENTEQNSQENDSNNQNDSQSKWERFKSVHNQRVSKKYGSTNRKQRWKRRIAKGAKAGAKGLLKGGAIGLVGTAAMAGALMTGNGKEALGIAAGIGAYAGKKTISGGKKVIKGAKGAVKDYYNKSAIPFLNPDQEKQAFKAFQADSKQMDKAVLSYRKNHGGEPTYEDLENEMNDRFALSRYGLSDDQIDNALGSFQKLRDSGIDENDALNQTAYAAKLAEDYSKKDFRSEKTMKEAVNTIADNFEKYGVGRDVAERNAEKYLRQAAGIKGVEIALPSTNRTVDVNVPSGERMAALLGVENSEDFDAAQLQRINNLTLRLHKAGMSNKEIEKIAKDSANSRARTGYVIDKFEAKVEFLTDNDAKNQAREYIASSNKINVNDVTDKQVKVEMQQRLELLSVGAKKEDMDSIRAVDDVAYGHHTKSEKDMALDLAKKYSERQMNNSKDMDRVIEDLAKELKKDGVVSDDGIKQATEIAERAANFKGTTITSKYTLK